MDPGDHVWIEEPGYLGARQRAQGGRRRSVPLRVDAEGWQLGAPRRPPPRLIFVTPSYQ